MRLPDGAPRAETTDRTDVAAGPSAVAERQPSEDQVGLNGALRLTVDETIARYRGDWILMKVTGFDEDGWPGQGYVLAHSPRRGDISKALTKEPPRAERSPDAPYDPYYIFKAFPRFRGGPLSDLVEDSPAGDSGSRSGDGRA